MRRLLTVATVMIGALVGGAAVSAAAPLASPPVDCPADVAPSALPAAPADAPAEAEESGDAHEPADREESANREESADEEVPEIEPAAATSQPSVADAAPQCPTAARTLGWGDPIRAAEFDDGLGPNWEVYDGPAPKGRRALSAVTIADGVMTITGDGAGTTGGVCWLPGQSFGRWELRMKAPTADPSYDAVALLWPDAEDVAAGGEIDFVDLAEPTRQVARAGVHHGSGTAQSTSTGTGQRVIDATQWHTWAVEWGPTHVAAFVDGTEWFRSDDTAVVPTGPMHLCIQLDWFPDGASGAPAPSTLAVDWVRQYAPPAVTDAP